MTEDPSWMEDLPVQPASSFTAAEAYIILEGPDAQPSRAVKVAITELIARGQLRAQGTIETRLVPVREAVGSLPPTLRALWDSLAAEPNTLIQGLSISEVGRLVRKHWGPRALKYVTAAIVPELRRRGIYGDEHFRRLRIFPSTRTALTDEGREVRQELQRLKRLSRGGPRRWEREVAGGVAGFAALAGASIFLFDQDRSVFRELALTQPVNVGAQVGNLHLPDLDGLRTIVEVADFAWGNIAISDSTDTFVDSFDSFDASFDSGGSDNGGDSGGGGGE